MKANELAELIEHLENAKYVGARKAATMLRQQQAEIEALKSDVEGYQKSTKIYKDLSNNQFIEIEVLKTKTLTDEEIIELFEHPDDFNCIDFARAILRKAQEK